MLYGQIFLSNLLQTVHPSNFICAPASNIYLTV